MGTTSGARNRPDSATPRVRSQVANPVPPWRPLDAYEAALTVRTREALPIDWAETQNNLALAYADRIRGDRADNLEKAIVAYEVALTVRTREALPRDHLRSARPPTTASFTKGPAGFNYFESSITGDKFSWTTATQTRTVTLIPSGDVFVKEKRADGRETAITLKPVWTLVAAEWSAKK